MTLAGPASTSASTIPAVASSASGAMRRVLGVRAIRRPAAAAHASPAQPASNSPTATDLRYTRTGDQPGDSCGPTCTSAGSGAISGPGTGFLGFAFRPRAARRKDGVCFTSFSPAISPEALKAKGADLRELRIHRRTDLSLDALARWLNPIVAGWMNYYGRYHRSTLYPLLRRVSIYLRRWAARKYKRLRTHRRSKRWWARVIDRAPDLFAHWQWIRVC